MRMAFWKCGKVEQNSGLQRRHQVPFESHSRRHCELPIRIRTNKDGKLTDAECAKLDAAQNKVSRDIAADKHHAVTGNPNSMSSKRMQAEVARSVKQEERIEAVSRTAR